MHVLSGAGIQPKILWNLGAVGTEDGGRRQVSWLGREPLWKAKDTSRCKKQIDRELIDQGARLVSLVPQSLRWEVGLGCLTKTPKLTGSSQAPVPSNRRTSRHHDDPVSFSKCFCRHDSHAGFTRERSSFQSILFPALLGL